MSNKILFSILGDSISTYRGVSDDRSVNERLFYNRTYYRPPFPLAQTWWRRVADRFGLELCVNNSYSGGNLSGREDDTSGVNRARFLSKDSGERPALIIIFMGINDLGRNIDAEVFAEDYERTLMTVRHMHPAASVCCVNLPDRDIFLKERAIIFNRAIAEAAEKMGEGFFVVDLFSSRLNNDFYYNNTLDGLHPDPDGMALIAEVVSDALCANGFVAAG